MPDGTIVRNVPEGTTQAELEVKLAARADIPGAGYRPDAPQSLEPPPATTTGEDILTGVRTASRNIGANIGIPGTDIDINALLEAAGARPIREVRQQYKEAGPAAGISRFGAEMAVPGGVARRVAGVLPATGRGISAILARLAERAPAVGTAARAAGEGAVTGALTGEGDLTSDIALGAGGGAAARAIIPGVGRLGTGFENISEEAKTLLKNQIPVTIGQAMPDTAAGRVLRGLEESATSVPIMGDIMVAGRTAGAEALRGKAIAAAVPPGMALPKSARRQPLKALDDIGAEFTKRYEKILGEPAVAKVPEFRPGYKILYRGGTGTGKGRWYTDDPAHAARFGEVQAIEVPVETAQRAHRRAALEGSVHYKLPDDYVVPAPSAGIQAMDLDVLIAKALPKKAKTGFVTDARHRKTIEAAMRADLDLEDATPKQLFGVQSDWRKHAIDLAKSPMKTSQDKAEAKAYLTAAEDILDQLEVSLPQGTDLKKLRGPYRNYVNLRHEAEKAKGFGETLTPTQIRKAAKRSRNKELEYLARSAESILPSRTPDSGTPRRAAQMALLGGATTAGVWDPTLIPAMALGLGGAAVPGLLSTTQTGSKYLLGQYGLQQAIARGLQKYSPTTGAVLATGEEN